jgi:hypothetical protein
MVESFTDPGRGNGEFTVLNLPNARNIANLSFTDRFLAYVDFPAVWLVSVALQGWRSIELVGPPLEPNPGIPAEGNSAEWKRLVADNTYEKLPRGTPSLLRERYRGVAL